MSNWTPKIVELRHNGVLVQKTIQRTENGPIELLDVSGLQDKPVAYQDTAKPDELVSAEDWDNIDPQWHFMYRPLYAHPQPAHDEITIDEWNGLTDKAKVLLIRHAPNWTTLQLIEEVEATLKASNK